MLDCLDVDELLLCAMPISRYRGEQAIGHRLYWRTIDLLTKRDTAAMPGQWHAHSIELFFLRLSRSGTRPIDVTVSRPAVLDVFYHHLAHICRLVSHTGAAHWDIIFPVLWRIAAPSLESLALSSDHVDPVNAGRTIVPRYLFTGHAPVLSKVGLTDMDVGSQEDLEPPECFRTLIPFTLMHPLQKAQAHRARGVLLEDPVFLLSETWEGIASLNIGNRRDRWNDLAIAMAHIPRVFLADCDAGGVYAVCNALDTRLTVAFPFSTSDTWHQPTSRPVIFASHCDPNSCVHNMLINLAPIQQYLALGSPISAFWNTLLTDRIAELAIALQNCRKLVGEHHLTRFALLETLVLTLMFPDETQWHHQHETFQFRYTVFAFL